MSATEHAVVSSRPSKLAEAVNQFNVAFGYDLRLPIDRDTVISAATIAGLRGNRAIADALRQGLDEVMEVVR